LYVQRQQHFYHPIEWRDRFAVKRSIWPWPWDYRDVLQQKHDLQAFLFFPSRLLLPPSALPANIVCPGFSVTRTFNVKSYR
jgi:hypothetical protein